MTDTATATVNRASLNDAITVMLNVALAQIQGSNLQAGFTRAPENVVFDEEKRLVDPYTIIYALPSASSWGRSIGFWGDMESPQRCSSLVYQLTNVGRNEEQSQRMADLTREAVLKRNPNGDFTHPITTSDALVIDRACTVQGGPEPSGGGLFQTVDKFNLEVSSV